MTPSKWSATCPTDLCAKTSGFAFASATVSGSSGQPGVSAVKPASSNTEAHRSQLLGRSQRPWTNTTGVRPVSFARSISRWSCSASVVSVDVIVAPSFPAGPSPTLSNGKRQAASGPRPPT